MTINKQREFRFIVFQLLIDVLFTSQSALFWWFNLLLFWWTHQLFSAQSAVLCQTKAHGKRITKQCWNGKIYASKWSKAISLKKRLILLLIRLMLNWQIQLDFLLRYEKLLVLHLWFVIFFVHNFCCLLQTECIEMLGSAPNNGVLKPGSPIVTTAGMMSAKKVVNVNCDGARGPRIEPTLRLVYDECINNAIRLNFNSITFPCLGTGRLCLS